MVLSGAPDQNPTPDEVAATAQFRQLHPGPGSWLITQRPIWGVITMITEKAISEKLLSHIGKDPDVTMFHRLSAMARRKGNSKVVATEAGTFGLLDWGVIEDPGAIEATVLPVPDEKVLPLRPRERHPAPSRDNVRVSGRGGDRGRKGREDREGRRKLQPLPELCFEALSKRTEPLSAVELAASLRDQEKVSEDLGAEALLNALREDNRRRQSRIDAPCSSSGPPMS